MPRGSILCIHNSFPHNYILQWTKWRRLRGFCIETCLDPWTERNTLIVYIAMFGCSSLYASPISVNSSEHKWNQSFSWFGVILKFLKIPPVGRNRWRWLCSWNEQSLYIVRNQTKQLISSVFSHLWHVSKHSPLFTSANHVLLQCIS